MLPPSLVLAVALSPPALAAALAAQAAKDSLFAEQQATANKALAAALCRATVAERARDLADARASDASEALQEALSLHGIDRSALADRLPEKEDNTLGATARALDEAERRLVGMDAQLTGGIKVSLPLWSAHPIYDALAKFSRRYPGIDLDISASDDHVDLARREADLAIRGMPKEKRPPKDIVGIKLMPISIGYYVHTNLLTEAAKGLRELTYIGSAPRHTQGELVTAGSLGLSGRHLFHSLMPRLMAVKHQLGVAVLPSMMDWETCWNPFSGDLSLFFIYFCSI